MRKTPSRPHLALNSFSVLGLPFNLLARQYSEADATAPFASETPRHLPCRAATHLSADVTRYSIGLATAPIDNFVTEFLPSMARRIHVRIVLVQRIINQVATTEGGGAQ